MSVTLHIDRLVLRGIDPLDQHALTSELKAELARMMADPSVRADMTQSRRTPVLRLGRMAMQPGLTGARALGGGVAKAIGASVGGRGMKP
jgi:hypothetical protein